MPLQSGRDPPELVGTARKVWALAYIIWSCRIPAAPSPYRQGFVMLKFFASTIGVIFLIGLLVVVGLLMLIF